MGVEKINATGSDVLIKKKTNGVKIDEQKLEVGMSIMSANDLTDSRATGRRKDFLDFLIDENPDYMISDEIELHILKSLLLDEEKIKMPDTEKVGETGFTFPAGVVGYKLNNNSFGEESSAMTIINQRETNGTKQVSSTTIWDNDNDGYLDSCEMFYDYGDNFRKTMLINFKYGNCFSEIKERRNK